MRRRKLSTREWTGDIVAVYNEAGTKLVSYKYDAWGSTVTTYHNGGASTKAADNPFTYRGYYYDKDLGFYCLGTRYYDSRICRFINADSVLDAGNINGSNLFSYCVNDPVNRYDPTGHLWDYVLDIVFIGLGVRDLIEDPSWENAGLLAVDVVLAVVPFIPAASGARHLGKVDDIVDAGKALNKVDNIADVAGAFNKSDIVSDIGKGLSYSTTKTQISIQNDIIGSPRIGSALKTDPYHSFPNIVDNYAGYSTKTPISNGILYQLKGSLNGVDGRFEWIIQNQKVTHRLFVKGGGINGIPILP